MPKSSYVEANLCFFVVAFCQVAELPKKPAVGETYVKPKPSRMKSPVISVPEVTEDNVRQNVPGQGMVIVTLSFFVRCMKQFSVQETHCHINLKDSFSRLRSSPDRLLLLELSLLKSMRVSLAKAANRCSTEHEPISLKDGVI